MSVVAIKTPFEESVANAGQGFNLGEVRQAAFDAFQTQGLPHRRLEAWRWTDLRAALKDAAPLATTRPVEPATPEGFSDVNPYTIVVEAGDVFWHGDPPAGVSLSRVTGAPLPTALADHPTALAAAALTDSALAIHVEENATIDLPILIQHRAVGEQRHARICPHLSHNARLTLIEVFETEAYAFLNATLEAKLDAKSSLNRIVLQRGVDVGVTSAVGSIAMGEAADLSQAALYFGGSAIRMETNIDLNGPGAKVSLESASLLSGARHADATSIIRHNAVDCEVRQNHRSAVSGAARAVFQGKFLVERDAQKTDAQMNAAALLLSDEAQANHKPELEIYADDVECAHGSTSGSLDSDALFYLRQRGLNEGQARALLIDAFVNETLDGVENDAIANMMRSEIARWLELELSNGL
ncbi:MAG: SufD family Fe-S cluster assembly protein [Pseudomonadota bacterium]